MNYGEIRARRPSILLVDDDVEHLKALTKVLRSEGYEVIDHPDATSALHFIESTKTPVALVISDVRMSGCDGLELLAALKRVAPAIPVILITAFASREQEEQARRVGAVEYLTKPLDEDVFLGVVGRIIGATTEADQPNHSKLTPNAAHAA